MKFKQISFFSAVLLIVACSNNDNKVSVEMKGCEGRLCSFDASKSKLKSHNQILEYDWDFHDGSEIEVVKEPKINHEFGLVVGETQDDQNVDLDLREVTLDEVLTKHQLISKPFKFSTHEHDPVSMFSNKSLLGASAGEYPTFHFDASDSEAGQGTIKKYIWSINGKVFDTTEPMLEYTADSNKNKVTLTVINSLGVQTSLTQNFVGLEPVIQEIYVTKISDLHYRFSYQYTDGDTSDEYDVSWKLNNKPVSSVENVPVVLGQNTVTVSLYEKNSKREVSQFSRTFNTTDSIRPKIIEIVPIKINYSDGLHYALTANYENALDTLKYQRRWYLNGMLISNESAKNSKVEEGLNHARLDILSRETGEVVESKDINFTAQKDDVYIAKVLFSMASDNMHYDIVSLETGFNPNTQKKIFELNGSIITDLNDIQFVYGLNTVILRIVDKTSGDLLAIKKGQLDTSVNTGIRSIQATLTPNTDEFHYDLSATFSDDFDFKKYSVEWLYNGERVEPQKLKLENGLNVISLYVTDPNKIITGANKKITINARTPEIKDVKINVDEDLANYGLEYSFVEQVSDMNGYYHTKWILNGKVLSSPSKQIVYDGRNTLELQIINNYTGDIIDSNIYNFTASKIIQPAFTSEVTATEVKDSDGLHYDFAVKTNDYDKSKYDLVYKLNGTTITSTTNVLVKEGANTVVAQIVAKDGTGKVVAEKPKNFEASEEVEAVISGATLGDDGLTYTFNTDGSTKGEGYKYEGKYGVDDNSVSEGTTGKWTYPAKYTDGAYKVTLTITSPNGKEVSSKPYEVTVKSLSNPTSKVSVTPDASNGLKFHFSREIDWNGRNPNDFKVQWLIDGRNGTGLDELGESFDYEFPKSKEGSHYVKLTLIEKSTRLEFKSEPVYIDVKDTSIPYESTPAAIIGQGIHSEHKGNSGASFPYITIDLNGSVQNKGVNFITGERLWNGKVGNNDTPYEQGNSYLHFNTGSATQEGFYDFSIELAKGDIHQVGTYSCKQKTTLWAIVWEPDLYDCTPIVWKDAYKV